MAAAYERGGGGRKARGKSSRCVGRCLAAAAAAMATAPRKIDLRGRGKSSLHDFSKRWLHARFDCVTLRAHGVYEIGVFITIFWFNLYNYNVDSDFRQRFAGKTQ